MAAAIAVLGLADFGPASAAHADKMTGGVVDGRRRNGPERQAATLNFSSKLRVLHS